MPAGNVRGLLMRTFSFVFTCVLLCSSFASAQRDLILMLNPYPNEEKIMVNAETSVFGKADDKLTGDEFRQFEQTLSLRAGLIQNEKRELYFTYDSHLVDLNTSGTFIQSGVRVPEHLYNVGVGLIYRQTIHEDWRIGGQLRVGSNSDELFHSTREMYAAGLGFLQIPHLEHTSWIAILAVNTNWQFPVVPGFGYSFPLSEQSLAFVGFPFIGAAGNLTEKLGFRVIYWPVRNADADISYQVTEHFRPHAGFKWRGQYFSRAGRSDSDDRVVLVDKRVYLGSVFDITPKFSIDVQGGYLFGREILEGDDFSDQNDNNFKIDSTWYSSFELRLVF